MAKRVLVGQVMSDKMNKTVVVEVVRKLRHPLYNKIIKKSKKYKADTNGLEIVFGNTVRIEETRPMSKDKYFKVIAKITEEQAKQEAAGVKAPAKKIAEKVTETKEAAVPVKTKGTRTVKSKKEGGKSTSSK